MDLQRSLGICNERSRRMRIKVYTGPIRNVLKQAPLTTLIVCLVLAIGMNGRATQQQDTDEDREIARLLKIIRNEQLRTDDPDQVGAAIATLGELRATVAVDDLIKLITFKRTFPQERGVHPWVIDERSE